MATYQITKSDGNPGPAILDAASPDTQTDLQLVGQNAVSYGLDVATSFYWLLENFANTSPPTTGSLGNVIGQAWYDTTPATRSLNLYNGSTWDQIANLNTGTVEGATIRWDNSSDKKWTEDVLVRISGTGILTIAGAGSGDVAISHDDTDLNITGTLTTDITFDGSIVAVNLPSLTLVTELDETYGGTGLTSYVTGDILYASGANVLAKLVAGVNGEILTLAGGVPSWASAGAGVTDLDSLSDVTASGAGTEGMLYKSAGDWLVSTPAQLGWDNGSQDLTVANLNGIAAVNLISRVAPGTLASTTFSGDILTSNADISLGDNDQIIFGSGNDVRVDFDNTDFVIDGFSAAADFNIINFTDALRVDTAIYSGITGSGGGEIKVLGTTNSNSTNEGFVSVNHNDDGQTMIRMGTESGNSFSEVNALVNDLNLFAANTLVMNIDPTVTTVTQGGITALVLRNAFLTGSDATTSATVADHNDNQHNIGYNETPDGNLDVGANLQVGSFTLSALSIGKLLSRTTSTSRSITLNTDADIPIGGSVLIHNASASGTLTIIPSGGHTLTWIDGSGSTPASATRTIDTNSIVTVRKLTSTSWQIWGNGIS